MVFDGLENVQIQPEESIIKVQWMPTKTFLLKNDKLTETLLKTESVQRDGYKNIVTTENFTSDGQVPYYFYIKPAQDRHVRMLNQLRAQQFHLRELPDKLKDSAKMNGETKSLLQFPQFSQVQQKIVIEF